MVTLFLVVPAPASANVLDPFTDCGKSDFRPERDLPVYLVGCAVSIVLGWSLACFWKRRVGRLEPADCIDAEWRAGAALILVTLSSVWDWIQAWGLTRRQ